MDQINIDTELTQISEAIEVLENKYSGDLVSQYRIIDELADRLKWVTGGIIFPQ